MTTNDSITGSISREMPVIEKIPKTLKIRFEAIGSMEK